MRSLHLAGRPARIGVLFALVLGMGLTQGRLSLPAAAQERPAVLTAVNSMGALWVYEDDRRTSIAPDIGRGGTVSALAWHPTRPEVLLVRRTFVRTDPREPSYALVYLDLATGREQTIIDGIGPQAEIVGPRIAPDGRSGFARLECCLSREIIRFALPLTGEPPARGPADQFLTPDQRDVSLVTASAFTPDGRVLATAQCCMGDDPATDPRGLYRVSADLTRAEKLAPGVEGVPLGLGPGGSWAAVLERAEATEGGSRDGWSLVRIELPGGNRVALPGGGLTGLSDTGFVAPDGRIVVAAWTPGDDPWPEYTQLTVVGPDASRSVVEQTQVTAFAWASAESVSAARQGAAAGPVGPQSVGPQTAATPAAPLGETTREIKVYFSRQPESDNDFSAVFPVTRRASDAGVATAALRELLRGPTPEEAAAGYYSDFPSILAGPSNCGGEAFTLRIQDGTATVRFCRAIASAGIGQDARTRSALEATLLQFSTIQRVRLLSPEGNCLFDMSGQNRCLSAP